MEIKEADDLRPKLFEAIEYKASRLYYATRSRKNAEEVRDYILVMQSLILNYIEIHENNFRLRSMKEYKKIHNPGRPPIKYMRWWCNIQNFSSLYETDIIGMKDIHAIRRWVESVFDWILLLHCLLEWMDYENEFDRRYMYIWWNIIFKQRLQNKRFWRWKSSKWGAGRASSWTSFGSKIDSWSGTFIARKEYDCYRCPEKIHPWQSYQKEVIRLGETVEIFRYHSNCPDDPNNSRRYHKENQVKDNHLPELKRAA